mmetsp:Transcript_30246/g.62955  ORF Transcript_30246/g.62955 Transcript_30246/m.62955 type:complete len:96 (-) Transcript_30246:13-300(-)
MKGIAISLKNCRDSTRLQPTAVDVWLMTFDVSREVLTPKKLTRYFNLGRRRHQISTPGNAVMVSRSSLIGQSGGWVVGTATKSKAVVVVLCRATQ